jgi:hypothetical protein
MKSAPPVIGLLLGAAGALAGQDAGTVTGTVRDSAGGALAGAEVLLAERRLLTTAQGSFRFDSIPVGPHLITIRLVGYTAVRARITVRTGSWHYNYVLHPAIPVLPTLVVEARRTGIYGTVGDTGVRPLGGVRVQLAGRGGGEVLTDSGGRFAFAGARDGQYVLRIAHPGFAEERRFIELRRGEGAEYAIRLRPSRRLLSQDDEVAVQELGRRLVANLRSDRLGSGEMERYGTLGLCAVPRIAARVRGLKDDLTIILNGTVVLTLMSVRDLCSWQAAEVELVEFGETVCRDVTRSLADLLNVWCRRSNERGEGMSRLGPQGGAFVVIWEKR